MKNYKKPFRIGKKQKRAILDSTSKEVEVFKKGNEQLAQEFCNYLNSKDNAVPSLNNTLIIEKAINSLKELDAGWGINPDAIIKKDDIIYYLKNINLNGVENFNEDL